MKYLTDKRVIFPFFLLMLTILASCRPATTGEPNQQAPVPPGTFTETAPTPTPPSAATASPTTTASATGLPTQALTPTASETAQPTETLVPALLPTTARPTRVKRRSTPTASPTLPPTSTETPPPTATPEPSPTICPVPTAESFSVEPVTSPTDQLTQVITVYIGNGEEVRVVSESGTFTVTGSGPFLVEISLLPNTVHHLEVFAKVRQVISSNGCVYGGYTLKTTGDRNGAPLTIIQGTPAP